MMETFDHLLVTPFGVLCTVIGMIVVLLSLGLGLVSLLQLLFDVIEAIAKCCKSTTTFREAWSEISTRRRLASENDEK